MYDCPVFCLSSGFDMRVNSASHQGKWVSAIALLAADPTMVRTAGAAKRCRTTTDNFNLFPYFKVEMIFFHSFNVKMISLFNFIKQLANSKSFLEQYSTPDETKYQDGICISRTSSKISFTIKSILSSQVCFYFGNALPISGFSRTYVP